MHWLVMAQIAFSCVLVALAPWPLALSWLAMTVGGTLPAAHQARRTRWRVRTRAHEQARRRWLDWAWLACVALACSLMLTSLDIAIQASLITALALLSAWIVSRPTEDAFGVGVALCILWIPESVAFLLPGFESSRVHWEPASAFAVSAASVMLVCMSHAHEFALQKELRERAQSHALGLVAERATAWRLVSAICHDLRRPGHALALYADHLARNATPSVDPLAAMAADGLKAAQRSLDRAGVGVRADKLMLWRVMSNLIDNAIAHSERGSSIALVARPSRTGVRLQVPDAGPGVPLHEQAQIFEDYVRVAPGARTRRQSFGLGLAIAKRMVVVMNGTISVRSAPGSCCCMTVTLPVASIAAHAPRSLSDTPAGARSVAKARKKR